MSVSFVLGDFDVEANKNEMSVSRYTRILKCFNGKYMNRG